VKEPRRRIRHVIVVGLMATGKTTVVNGTSPLKLNGSAPFMRRFKVILP